MQKTLQPTRQHIKQDIFGTKNIHSELKQYKHTKHEHYIHHKTRDN